MSEELPKWITSALNLMTRFRRNRFIRYIEICLNVSKYCKIQKIGTVSWTYGIEKRDRRRIQYMPLSAMIKNCKIVDWNIYTEKDSIGPAYYTGTEFKIDFEPYQIFKEIHKMNENKLQGGTHGICVSTDLWRYQNLMKQRYKVKKMYPLLQLLNKHTKEARAMYREWLSDVLLPALTKVKLHEAGENMYKYSREHSKSKVMPKLRWGSLSVKEAKIIAWANKQAVLRLQVLLRNLDEDMTLIWDLDIGFEAIRTRTEITTLDGNTATEKVHLSRDARGLGFLSHMFGLLGKTEIRSLEERIINKFGKLMGIKVYSPLLNNKEMWTELREQAQEYFGYDGSNWQALVGMVLGSPISLIFYGWQLLCSGTNVTSLEGILAMILVSAILFGIHKGCYFGDDIMIPLDAGLGYKNLVLRDENLSEKVFLGYDIVEKRVRSIKICVDRADKMLSAGNIGDIKWYENRPNIQQQITLLIVYGFSEVTDPIQLNINSQEFTRSSEILQILPDKMWRECVQEYNSKFKEWWK